MQNIQQEMERHKQEQEKMQNELKGRIENNSEFRKLKDELQKQGYAPSDQEIKPESMIPGILITALKRVQSLRT